MREISIKAPVDSKGTDSTSIPRSENPNLIEDDQRIIFRRVPPTQPSIVSKRQCQALAEQYPGAFVCVLPEDWTIAVEGDLQPEEYVEGERVPATLSR